MKGNKFFKKIDRFLGVPLVFLFGLVAGLARLFQKETQRTLSEGDRVLVVKLSALGDTLILLPVFKAIKQKVGPQGKVLAVVTPINQAALEGFPYIDEVIVLDFGTWVKKPSSVWGLFSALRAFKPRFALDFDQWLRISPLLCFLSGASRRYGFKTPGQYRHFLYHRTTPNEKTRHEFEQFVSIAALAGVPRETIDPFNGFLEKEGLYQGSTKGKNTSHPLVHIHPGCGAYGWQRAWPETYYIQLIQKLAADGIQVRVTGMGNYEEQLVAGIIRESGVAIDNRAGKLGMSELSGLVREADLVVCGNTGILHLATGLGKPVVVMNGPANPIKWGALGPVPGQKGGEVSQLLATVPCSPCTTLGYEYGCPKRPCMESIPVEKVYQECLRLLGRGQKTK